MESEFSQKRVPARFVLCIGFSCRESIVYELLMSLNFMSMTKIEVAIEKLAVTAIKTLDVA